MGIFSRESLVAGLVLIVAFSLFDVTYHLVGDYTLHQLIAGRGLTWLVGLIVAWFILRKWRNAGR